MSVAPAAPAASAGSQVAAEALALQRLYHWETTAPERVVFTQPVGDGKVLEYTWRQVMDESRRMAAYLKAQGFEPGARIAILSKNCAHWLMSDFAIWLAGFVSVPLYPTLAPDTIRQILAHSESRLLFVGKLDGWENMKPGAYFIASASRPRGIVSSTRSMATPAFVHCHATCHSRGPEPARTSRPAAPPRRR